MVTSIYIGVSVCLNEFFRRVRCIDAKFLFIYLLTICVSQNIQLVRANMIDIHIHE